MVARLVYWRWIGGGEVEGVGGRVAVLVEWGSDKWRWRSSGGGRGGESGSEGDLSAVAVVRAAWWSSGGGGQVGVVGQLSVADGGKVEGVCSRVAVKWRWRKLSFSSSSSLSFVFIVVAVLSSLLSSLLLSSCLADCYIFRRPASVAAVTFAHRLGHHPMPLSCRSLLHCCC